MEGLLLAGVRAAGYVQQAGASFVAVSKQRSARSSAYALVGFVKQCSEGQEGKGRNSPKACWQWLGFTGSHKGTTGWTRSSREGMRLRFRRQLAAFTVG